MLIPEKRLSIANTTTTIANRRKNKKTLSLFIAPEKVTTIFSDNTDDLNAYPRGPIKIMPNLYLGNEKNSLDLHNLQTNLSIHSILNVATEVNSNISDTIQYHKFPWHHHQRIVNDLFKAIEIIDNARQSNQPILVHCQCGVSRSAAVIIAYVMKSLDLSSQEAYQYVKNIVPIINPNLDLLFQLREFEQVLNSKKSVNLFYFNII